MITDEFILAVLLAGVSYAAIGKAIDSFSIFDWFIYGSAFISATSLT